MQPRTDTDKADAEVEAITKSTDYSLARQQHMRKQTMPDGIHAGQPAEQRKSTFVAPNTNSNEVSDEKSNEISATQIDTQISTLRDSMLCTAVIQENTSATTEKRELKIKTLEE